MIIVIVNNHNNKKNIILLFNMNCLKLFILYKIKYYNSFNVNIPKIQLIKTIFIEEANSNAISSILFKTLRKEGIIHITAIHIIMIFKGNQVFSTNIFKSKKFLTKLT